MIPITDTAMDFPSFAAAVLSLDDPDQFAAEIREIEEEFTELLGALEENDWSMVYFGDRDH